MMAPVVVYPQFQQSTFYKKPKDSLHFPGNTGLGCKSGCQGMPEATSFLLLFQSLGCPPGVLRSFNVLFFFFRRLFDERNQIRGRYFPNRIILRRTGDQALTTLYAKVLVNPFLSIAGGKHRVNRTAG